MRSLGASGIGKGLDFSVGSPTSYGVDGTGSVCPESRSAAGPGGSRLTVLTDVKAGKPRSHSTPRGLAAGPRESFTSLILRFLACKMGHVMASTGNRDVERSAQRLA